MADHRRYLTELFASAGGFLLGRITYEIFAAYWPTVTTADDYIARALNTLPKYVVSTTLSEAGWEGTTIIKKDVVKQLSNLKEEAGQPLLVVGSSDLAQTLIQYDLIDEYQLWLHPVVLGSGKRLFRENDGVRTLRLIDSRTTAGGGLVILTYGT